MTGTPPAVPDLFPRLAEVPELGTLLARVAAAYAPEHVLLFGSRARGDARPDSDWDLLVLLPDGADEGLLDPLLGFETQQGSGVHADVACAYLGEFLADAAVPNSLARAVADHAVRVYDRPRDGGGAPVVMYRRMDAEGVS